MAKQGKQSSPVLDTDQLPLSRTMEPSTTLSRFLCRNLPCEFAIDSRCYGQNLVSYHNMGMDGMAHGMVRSQFALVVVHIHNLRGKSGFKPNL